jgi:hypothetical protein
VITKVFEKSYLRGRKVKTIPTYGKPDAKMDYQHSREVDEEILEELRTLGYIK